MASGRILEKYSGIWQKIGNMVFGPLADFCKKCDDGLWPNFGKCYLALWPNFGKCYSSLWPTLERDKKHQSDQANADQHRPTQANKMAGARPTQTNTGQHRPTYPTHQGSAIIFGFSEKFEILGASVRISNLIFYLFKLCVDKIICCLALLKNQNYFVGFEIFFMFVGVHTPPGQHAQTRRACWTGRV